MGNFTFLPKVEWVDLKKVEKLFPFRLKTLSKIEEHIIFKEIKSGINIEKNIERLNDVYKFAVDNFLHVRGITESDERYDEYKDKLSLRLVYCIKNYNPDGAKHFKDYLKEFFRKDMLSLLKQEQIQEKQKSLKMDPFNDEVLSYGLWRQIEGKGTAKDQAEKILSVLPEDLKSFLFDIAQNKFSQSELARKIGCTRANISCKVREINRHFTLMRNVHYLKEKGMSNREIAEELKIRIVYVNYFLQLYDYMNDLGNIPELKYSPLFNPLRNGSSKIYTYNLNLKGKGE